VRRLAIAAVIHFLPAFAAMLSFILIAMLHTTRRQRDGDSSSHEERQQTDHEG
jgi:hypothetical protein